MPMPRVCGADTADVLVAFGASKALKPFIKGGLGRALAKIDGKLGGLLKEAIFGAGVEWTQEGTQQFLQAYVDEKLTGQEHDLLREALEAANVGGAIGIIFGGAGAAVRAPLAAREAKGEAEAQALQDRAQRRTEPVVRKPLEGISPEVQAEVESFAGEARKAKPPDVGGSVADVPGRAPDAGGSGRIRSGPTPLGAG